MGHGTVHAIDESANDSFVEVARNDSIDVQLGENATTGFRWRVKATGAPVLELADDRTAPGPKNRPGASGSRRFRFRAAVPGSATIKLVYARRVPANAPPAKAFVLRVRVLP
ncbi:MAG TPA: protease inhibitor I42 family protein [Polyangiaceae bacterium]|nr:protease inhibitor I42 family protein [Polyangiaceae bacterium]